MLLITPEKPRLSLLIGDGMLYTHMSFVTELMIKTVPASLTHAKDPSIHSVIEYTREAEIKSVHWRWYDLYTCVVVCYCTDDLSSVILSYPCSNL